MTTRDDFITLLKAAQTDDSLKGALGAFLEGEDVPARIVEPTTPIFYVFAPYGGQHDPEFYANTDSMDDDTAPITAVIECTPSEDGGTDFTCIGFLLMPTYLVCGSNGEIVAADSVLNPSEATRYAALMAILAGAE